MKAGAASIGMESSEVYSGELFAYDPCCSRYGTGEGMAAGVASVGMESLEVYPAEPFVYD